MRTFEIGDIVRIAPDDDVMGGLVGEIDAVDMVSGSYRVVVQRGGTVTSAWFMPFELERVDDCGGCLT